MRLAVTIGDTFVLVEGRVAAWLDISDARPVNGAIEFTYTGDDPIEITGPVLLYRRDGTVALTSRLPDKIRGVQHGDTVTLSFESDLEMIP